MEVEAAINTDFGRIFRYMDKRYEENEMRRNHQKYKVMVLRKTTENPVFKCASYCNRKRN